jgi:Amt family ammonium transporter
MFTTCTAVQCVVTLLWFVCGYSLVFGAGGNAFIGGLDRLFMSGVTPMGPLVGAAGARVPEALYAVFHSTYAAITPCVIVGAYAGRMRFSASVMFCAAWVLTVYVPFARMVWGGGFLEQIGLIDFAGGVVIHVTAGMSALVAAKVVGPRRRFTSGDMGPGHSPIMVMAGTGLIWAAWLGFNGGSTPSGVSVQAAWVFLTTMCAGAAGGASWLMLDTFAAPAHGGDAHVARKPTGLGACYGIVAGLVCITPAALFVSPWAAVAMGAVGALVCRAACGALRATAAARGVDDACEVFGIHGTGGILGNALTAIFAATTLGGTRVVANIPAQFALHMAAAGAACLWSAGWTWAILKALDLALPGGIRVDAAVEDAGLDIGEHGEVAYVLLPAPLPHVDAVAGVAVELTATVAAPSIAAMAAARDGN